MREAEKIRLIDTLNIKTFPIPKKDRVQLFDKKAGIKEVHLTNIPFSAEVMPGNLDSPLLYQQDPCAIQMKNGKVFNPYGNLIIFLSLQRRLLLLMNAYIEIKIMYRYRKQKDQRREVRG